MSADALYLYALVRPDTLAGLELAGVEEGTPVTLLPCGGVDAVVSRVPRGVYEDSLGTDGPADAEWVVPRALRHDAVVRAVAAGAPALPARFGSVFSTELALKGVVGHHELVIAQFLDDVSGRAEYTLRAWYDPASAAARLLAEDPAFAARLAALPAGPGARYMGEKRLREEAAAAVRSRALAAARSVRARLAGVVPTLDVPLRRPEPSGRTMVLNLACLLDPAAAAGLPRLRDDALSEGPPGFEVEAGGPWPAFHFCPDLAPVRP